MSISSLSERQTLVSPHLRRERITTRRLAGGRIGRGNKELLSFSDNDYLGLAAHPHMVQAAVRAIGDYGAGAGASRLVTGNHPLYAELEQQLAGFKQCEDSLVYGSGYLVNLGVLAALPQKGDLVLADRLIHASMIDGVRLGQARHLRYRHCDMADLETRLRHQRADYHHCYIVTESVFSMDGDSAPLAALAELAVQYDAMLVVDDAHGLGVLNAGYGVHRPDSLPPQRWIIIGTFSKAAGSYGGYVCATSTVIERLVNCSRSLIYTTALPPAVIAANSAALDWIKRNPQDCGQPLRHAELFCHLLELPPAQSAIVPLILGAEQTAVDAAAELMQQGYLVAAIRPPTVPPGTSRLRFTFSAAHRREDVQALAQAVRDSAWFAACR